MNITKAFCLSIALLGASNMQAITNSDFVIQQDNTKINNYQTNRPEASKRLFVSQAVEQQIAHIKQLLTNARLAWMFENCFPNTLDTTVHFDGIDVLDFSRKEVVDCIYEMMYKILSEAKVSYIKWDMNRQLTEVGSATLPAERQRELWHRYVLGVYDLMDRLTTDYPHILLENCSGGGARFDPGMLYYSPQIWCSDDTDAIERLKIQHGTSMCYPCSAMGAHVSDCPNHTVGRNTPFKTRGHVAMVGTFGYELDVTRIPQEDRDAIPAQIEEFNKFNKLVRTGDHYRIGNMFEDNTWDAWEFVAKDKSEALFEFVQVLGRPNERSRRIKLKGLEADAYYYEESEPDKKISGAALMNAGINIAKMWNGDGLYGDFCSKILHFIKM